MFAEGSISLTEVLRLLRIRTLTAAFSPVILGASFAMYHYEPYESTVTIAFHLCLLLLTVLIAQGATNVWNEYHDFASGLDLGQTVGNSGSITKQNVSPRIVKKIGIYMLVAALCLGLLLSALTTLWLIPIGLICITIAYCYSGGPYPISRTPFGELASGFAMGFAIIMIAAYLWAGKLHMGMIIPAIPSTILIGLILQCNSLRDMVNDAHHGRKTLPIIIGRDNTLQVMAISYTIIFAWTLLWMLLGALPNLSLIALGAAFPAYKAYHRFTIYSDPHSLDTSLKLAAITNTLYHGLLSIALILSSMFW